MATLKYSWQHSRTLRRLNIFFSNSALNRSTVFYFDAPSNHQKPVYICNELCVYNI